MHLFLIYLLNPWVLALNAGILTVFGLKAWDMYAKTWLAGSGKYSTSARITYTEFRDMSKYTRMLGDLPNEGMICYAYHVDGRLFTGTLPPEDYSRSHVENHLMPGSEITVYYSPRAPQHAFPHQPPSRNGLFRHAFQQWLFTPFAVVNVIAFFTWHLFQQAATG